MDAATSGPPQSPNCRPRLLSPNSPSINLSDGSYRITGYLRTGVSHSQLGNWENGTFSSRYGGCWLLLQEADGGNVVEVEVPPHASMATISELADALRRSGLFSRVTD
jgi:hypothetical protein